ncbi:MAG: Fe-S protein assembly co-chaperone HscB [Phycisphaeraceae bacterium]
MFPRCVRLVGVEDPFTALGMPRRFRLDEEELERRFVSLSSEHHPDRHTDPIAQADAAEASSKIGHAYQVLADPEKRANALLALRGGPAKEDDQSLPPELLMEVMEVREELEQAIEQQDEADLARLRQWAQQQRDQRLQTIGDLLEQGDPEMPLDEQTAKRVRLELNALRYAQRMLEQMEG